MIGVLITFLMTHVFWRKRNMKLSVQSVRFSLLAGRIFLKNMSIMTKNELVMIHTATITWQYWIRHVRKSQLYVQTEDLNDEINRALPARFVLKIVGLESFIYNKSAAYDEIEKIIKVEREVKKTSKKSYFKSKRSKPTDVELNDTSSLKRRNTTGTIQYHSSANGKTSEKRFSTTASTLDDSTYTMSSSGEISEIHEVMDSTFLDFLPIEVNISKAATVIGNETTPQLYVISCSSIAGMIDATLPECKLDYYRTHYDFMLANTKVDLKKNASFKDMDSLEREIIALQQKKKTKRFMSMMLGLRNSLRILNNKFHHSRSMPPYQDDDNSTIDDLSVDNEEWHGLERYLTAATTIDSLYTEYYDYEKQKMINTEYAKYSNILETEWCKVSYYYDSQGLIPFKTESEDIIPGPDIGNKGPPPMFGLDITLSGATLTYGPWAEKQRNAFQQLLFPTVYRHLAPMERLQPGCRRQYVSFDFSIQCENEAVFRIPHREASKDILYLEKEISSIRPFGWLDLKLGKGSIVEMSIALVTTSSGTRNTLNAVFSDPEILTSVNHDVLFKAEKHILNATIDFPLQWNSLAEWHFENLSHGANLYLLREHVTLLTDLFGDFSSGDPMPYELFRPFIYHFNWKMYDYTVYLNINEQNIINNPLDSTINTYLTINGDNLDLSVNIPFTTVYKKSNTVDFKLVTEYFYLSIEHPVSSTFANFLNTNEIGHARNFVLDGSYTYFSFLEIDAVDTIIMNCNCDDTTVKAYGFVIKYFMYLKENYFGDTIHFQNLLEFRENYGIQETIHEGKRLSNETDLMFSFSVDNGCLIFPCHLYDCSSHLALHFDELTIDVRNNNYYMDLQADFSEVRGRYIEDYDESKIFQNTISKVQFVPEIYIDDLSIHSIRLFGLPPTEPTYFCRWNFVTSGINIDSEPIFINALTRAGRSFGFGHTDIENSMGLPVVSVPDILNLSFRCVSVNIQIKRMDYCFKINLDDIFFKLSDQPSTFYNSLMTLVIKDIHMSCNSEDEKFFTLNTSLKLQNFIQKQDAFEFMKEQAMHLKKHDAPFHRTPFLIPEFAKDIKYFKGLNSLTSSIYMADPPLPLTSHSIEMVFEEYPERIQKKLANLSSSFDDQDDEDDYDCIHDFSSDLEDFGILKSLDSTCSYDNLLVEFGEVETYMSPKLMLVLVDIVTNMIDFNMYSFLDELQTDFILFYKYTQKNVTMNCKIDCPIFTLKFSDQMDSSDYVFLGVTDLIFAFAKGSISQKETLNVYSLLKELNFDFVKDAHDTVLVTLKNILLKQSVEGKSITTFDNEDISIYIDPIFLPGAADILMEYFGIAKTAIERWNELRDDIRKAGIELLYDLSRGGIDYNISHDPPCITKPSYISGFSSNHIRLDGNWMIIPRLRHVLHNLPPDYIRTKDEMFKNKLWEAPMSAEDDVTLIFGNWRVWDNHKTKDNFILKKVFETVTREKAYIFKSAKLTLRTITVSINPFGKALVIKNTLFVFAEDYLSKEVKEFALPLLDKPIEISIDATLKMDSLAINFTKSNRIFGDLTYIIEQLEYLKKKYVQESSSESSSDSNSDSNFSTGSTVSLKNEPLYEEAPSILTTMNFSLDEYSCSVGLDKSVITFYGQNSILTASMIQTDQILSYTINSKNQFFGSNMYVDAVRVFEITCDEHCLSLINTGSFETGNTVVFFSDESFTFSFLPETKQLVKVLTTLFEHEYGLLKPVLEVLSKRKQLDKIGTEDSDSADSTSYMQSVIQKVQNKFFSTLSCNVSVSFKTAKTLFHFELLSPFFMNYEIEKLDASFKIGDFGAAFQFAIMNSTLSIGSQNKKYLLHYLEASIDLVNWLIAAHDKENAVELLVRTTVQLIRLNFAQTNLIDMIDRGQSDLKTAKKNLEVLQAKIKKYKNIFTLEQTSLQPAKNEDDFDKIATVIQIILDINLTNVNGFINVNGNKLHLDFHKSQISMRTYNEDLEKFRPYGTVSLPSVRAAIGLVGVHGISTLLDMQFIIQIKNPDSTDHKLQKLSVISDYCRLVLNPHIVEELIEAYGDIMMILAPPAQQVAAKTIKEPDEEILQAILSFFSINILSKNFCIGWLFNEEDQKYSTVAPGLILGFENISLICATGAGKFQTQGMYLSAARGFTPSTFYSSSSEKNTENRIYFPLFNLVYTINCDGECVNFKSQVTGDRVDFKFQTDIFSITEPLWISINSLQERFSNVSNQIEKKRQRSAIIESTVIVNEPIAIVKYKHPKVITFNVISKFEGASFFIYNSHIEIDGAVPILNLQTPKISTILKYVNDKNALKKHAIFLSAHIMEKHNKLSSQCSPIIQDIVNGCQKVMKQANKHSKANPKPKRKVKTDSGNGFDIMRLSEMIDVNFSLIMEPQSLTLTCEPKANIEAEVGLKEIHLLLKTEQDFFSGVLIVKSMKSELKHAYSKVTSGSIQVHDLTINSTMSLVHENRNICTLVKIENIDAYVNIQQRQDLDLFRDFWWPRNMKTFVTTNALVSPQKKSFGSLIKEVSTTTAFPWVVSLIIMKTNVKVDLGSSLGTLSIYTENFNTLSIKSIDWDHNLKIQFDLLSLESVGRLSGNLCAQNMRMTSAISWKLHDEVLKIPLVLLSFGIGSLQTKISLDYHPFFIFEINNIGITTFNQREKSQADKLKSSIKIENFRVFMTALTASNFVDIYTIGLRITQEIHLSYKQVLNDANIDKYNEDTPKENISPSETFRSMIEKLETYFDVNIGSLRIQVYPSNLLDSQALVINIGKNKASFYQKTVSEMLNKLLLDISNINVSLSGFKNKPSLATLTETDDIRKFVESAIETIDDNLFVFPSLRVGMKTVQHGTVEFNNKIDYEFYCKFDGKVDIKWKIGSVYFIRQMWYSHATSLNDRLVALHIFTSDEYDEENYKKNTFESVNLEARLKDVESDKKFVYLPLNEPIIETPQLKDLGSATPPLEWFGLHRDKFPNLTHQFVIIGLQKLIKEVEEKYSKVLK